MRGYAELIRAPYTDSSFDLREKQLARISGAIWLDNPGPVDVTVSSRLPVRENVASRVPFNG